MDRASGNEWELTDEEITSEVGQRIKQERERQGLSQKVVGLRCGFAPDQMSRIEHGHRPLKTGELLRVAAALETTAAFFLDGLLQPHHFLRVEPAAAVERLHRTGA